MLRGGSPFSDTDLLAARCLTAPCCFCVQNKKHRMAVKPCGVVNQSGKLNYFSSTLAPTSSSFFCISSASALGSLLLQLGIGGLDELLGLHQGSAGQLLDSLDDLHLVGADVLQDDVELGLLFLSGERQQRRRQREQQRQQRKRRTPRRWCQRALLSSRTVIVLTDSTMAVIFSEAMVITSIIIWCLSGAWIERALRRGAHAA